MLGQYELDLQFPGADEQLSFDLDFTQPVSS